MISVEGIEIEEGTRVKLTKPDPDYDIGHSNPLVGTKWECEGIYTGGGGVDWENGCGNSYKNGELSLADGCVSIWVEKWG